MPARPVMLDEIETKLAAAPFKELLKPVCSYNDCGGLVKGMIHMATTDGKHDIYFLCSPHLGDVARRNASVLLPPRPQGAFFL